MKKLGFISFAIIILISSFTAICAQVDEPPPIGEGQPFASKRRPNLLQELGLNKNQIQQLRQINRELQPQMRQAQRNLREATQALDEAIYADESNDSLVQEKVKDLQMAQAEMIKNRTIMETSIRKILTREQLIKFRDLRQQFKPNNLNKKLGNENNRTNEQPNQTPRRKLRQLQKRQTI